MEGGFYSDCKGGSDVKLMTVNYVTAILFILCLSSVTIVKSLSLTDTISSPGNKSIVDHAVRKRGAHRL
jgi:hypothetical protein